MKDYQDTRKKIWEESDKLNRMENEKVYQKDLNRLIAQYNNSKLELNQKMDEEYKTFRKKADKLNDKKLVKNIRKIAKKVNRKKIKMHFSLEEEVVEIKQMDLEYMDAFEQDLKIANISLQKFQ